MAMLEYRVSAHRIGSHGSEATTKNATVLLDTDINGRPDAFNPAELLLASLDHAMRGIHDQCSARAACNRHQWARLRSGSSATCQTRCAGRSSNQ
jgi:hypothetical protein